MADFAVVGIGDRNASSWLLVVFTVPVRLAAAREYCEIVRAGEQMAFKVGETGSW